MQTSSTAVSAEQQQEQFRLLTAKINALLPPRYKDSFEEVPPESMGSAKLELGPDGKVAWDEIWTSFCHLALAGGPPHRGTLLEPVSAEEVAAQPELQRAVVAEIERAIRMVTWLSPAPSPTPGWVGVRCYDEDMAAWLVRAIVAENVIARRLRNVCLLPAGPKFRLEKEVKNVVVSLAKTCHYLLDHVRANRRPAGLTRSLVEPASADEIAASPEKYAQAVQRLAEGIGQSTGLTKGSIQAAGWLGVRCLSVEMAVWLLRAIVVEDVLVRREGAILCLPVSLNEIPLPAVEKVVAVVGQAWRLWQLHASSGERPVAESGK
jgi:sirohydrochlorin cobaltochelatase